jgi:uncharacterized protein YlbG (UPF0298 family)
VKQHKFNHLYVDNAAVEKFKKLQEELAIIKASQATAEKDVSNAQKNYEVAMSNFELDLKVRATDTARSTGA